MNILFFLDAYLKGDSSGRLYRILAKVILLLFGIIAFIPTYIMFRVIYEFDFDVSLWAYLFLIIFLYIGITIFMLMVKRSDQISEIQDYTHLGVKLYSLLIKSLSEFIGLWLILLGLIALVFYAFYIIDFEQEEAWLNRTALFELMLIPSFIMNYLGIKSIILGFFSLVFGKYYSEKISVNIDIYNEIKNKQRD